MYATLSRRARTAAATAVAASAVCGALFLPATAQADAPTGQSIKLSVAELPHSPLINELARGGEAANFQFTATNSGDKAEAFAPVVHGLPLLVVEPTGAKSANAYGPLLATALAPRVRADLTRWLTGNGDCT